MGVKIMGKLQRIDKILSNSGYGTRREMKDVIKNKQVQVNGTIVSDPGLHVDVEIDEVVINGKVILYRKYVYLMMNKPQGVLSATEDMKCATVLDLISEEYKRYGLFPTGRLDKDTEGLLLLTNNGQLSHDMLSPKKHVSKLYYAKVEGNIPDEVIHIFKGGIELDKDFTTLPAELKILNRNESSTEVEIVIYEGKFHQIKRMFEAVDSKVLFLKRLQMGDLRLDSSLEPGAYRELTADERMSIGANN